jgi:hypothetical protein
VKPQAIPDVPPEPMFRWSANLIMINQRRAIIVCNDSSQYGFMLYGIKAKDLKDLGAQLLQGVRESLEAECIAPEIQERYMADCGTTITFTKTPNRSVVARLNLLGTKVRYYDELLNAERLLQSQILLSLNHDIGAGSAEAYRVGNRTYIDEQFAEDLSQRYGTQPYSCRAAEFEVELMLETACKRRIIVPLSYTFKQFHYILQSLFNWQGYHQHEFMIESHRDGSPRYTLLGCPRDDEFSGETTRLDRTVLLSEIFPEYDSILYTYDLEDEWNHDITLIRIIDEYDSKHAVCLGGEGEAPPEDSGGPMGYEDLLAILADPEDPEHEHMKSWYGGMRCLPFDLERINNTLRHTIRWSERFV